MNRGSFLRNLFGAAAAIVIAPAVKMLPIAQTAALPTAINASLFNDLNFIIPEWYPKMVEKYGNSNYMEMVEWLCNTNEKE